MLARELAAGALTGRPVRGGNFTQLPASMLQAQDRLSHHAVRSAVALADAYHTYSQAYRAVPDSPQERAAYAVLKEELSLAAGFVANGSHHHNHDHHNHQHDSQHDDEGQFVLVFYMARGHESAMDFLQREFFPSALAARTPHDAATHNHNNEDPEWEQRLAAVGTASMSLLKDMCYCVEECGAVLGARDDLVCALLRLLGHRLDAVAETSALFLEDLLLARRATTVFDLRKAGDTFPALLRSWNVYHLLLFCRVVGLLTTDAETRAAAMHGEEQRSPPAFALLDARRRSHLDYACGREHVPHVNQLVLLEQCPELLARLVQLLEDAPSEAELKRLWTADVTPWRREEEEAAAAVTALPTVLPPPMTATGGGGGLQLLSGVLQLLLRAVKAKVTGGGHPTSSSSSALIVATAPVPLPAQLDAPIMDDDDADDDDDDEDSLSSEARELFEQRFGFWDEPDDDDDGTTTTTTQRDMWLLGQRLEAAHVLCAFCTGPHKKRAQDELNRLGLVRALEQRFDSLVWDVSFRSDLLDTHFRVHGENCECNPQQAFKSQLLRLVHNFCDRESDNRANKLQLFSAEERAAMQQQQQEASKYWRSAIADMAFAPPLDSAATPQERREDAQRRAKLPGLPGGGGGQHSDRGLAWRICAALLLGGGGELSEGETSLRFWECAALEALLRGGSVACKLMVCSWGVLDFVAELVMRAVDKEEEDDQEDDDEEEEGQFQTCFDLLAELVKDNPVAIAYLCGQDTFWGRRSSSCFAALVRAAHERLVDGNVFVRSVLLTAHRTPWLTSTGSAPWFEFPRMAPILAKLFTAIRLEHVSQENLCCLNTAVVMCTFARQEGQLSQLVREARQLLEGEEGEAAVVNFRKLVWFWRCYYSCRAVDRISLEHSSGIKFEELEATSAALAQPGVLIELGQPVVRVDYVGNALPARCARQEGVVTWGEL